MNTSDEVSRGVEEVACTISNIAKSDSKQAELTDHTDNAVKDVVEGLNHIT